MNQMKTLESLRSELKRKGDDFSDAREKAVKAVNKGMQELRSLIGFVESSIISEIEEAFEVNKFADALEKLSDLEEGASNDELERIRRVARAEVVSQIGPSRRDFLRVQEMIIGLANWSGEKPLNVPTHVEGRSCGADTVEVVWDSVEKAMGYHVEMRRPNEGAFQRVYEGSDTRYRVNGLCSGTRLLFRVRSVLGNGAVSEWSECVKVSIPVCATQYLCAEAVSEFEIAVSWDDINALGDEEEELPTYHVEMRSQNQEGSSHEFQEIYCGSETMCSATGLRSEEEYLFIVKTIVGDKCISSSCPVNARTKIAAPKRVRARVDNWDSINLTWESVCSKRSNCMNYVVEMRKGGSEFVEIYRGGKTKIKKSEIEQETEYSFRVRAVVNEEMSEWSEVASVRTQKAPDFCECAWKECPDSVFSDRIYSIDGANPKIASLACSNGCCTITGDTPLPLSKIASWSIKVLKSKEDDGHCILVGVAPFDINRNCDNNSCECGWYFYCYDSALYSGPPHNYRGKKYVPWKEEKYLFLEKTIGITMDTAKGDLSFVLNGMNLGVAYEGIPLDKPLVPCVLLDYEDDSVELVVSEVKENVDSSIRVPANVALKNDSTWDSLVLSWDAVYGVSFYQIEFDGAIINNVLKLNKAVKRGLLPDTEHTFRVRAVIGNKVSEWSCTAKGRTQESSFEASGWKECPDGIADEKKYSIDSNNPRTAVVNSSWSTIVGSTPLPSSRVTSWSIKILDLIHVSGNFNYVGVAPFDIDQSAVSNHYRCGWYINSYDSTLVSGPPHRFKAKAYGTKYSSGGCIHAGDTIGIVMDTAKGELSFVVDDVGFGTAYEEIPLDKPLVPCVVLRAKKISVELVNTLSSPPRETHPKFQKAVQKKDLPKIPKRVLKKQPPRKID